MRQLNVLRMIMDTVVKEWFITLNPVKRKKVHLTNQSRQERQPLTREEMMDAISRISRVVKPFDRCLGHSSFTVTETCYVKFREEALRSAKDLMERSGDVTDYVTDR